MYADAELALLIGCDFSEICMIGNTLIVCLHDLGLNKSFAHTQAKALSAGVLDRFDDSSKIQYSLVFCPW